MINPNTINEGEEVVIQDDAKNVLRGTMVVDEKGNMAIEAFRTQIRFARWSTRDRGGYVPVKGIKIVGHQPAMDGLMSFDVVPKQRVKSNPT
jgi:hypothetical protein